MSDLIELPAKERIDRLINHVWGGRHHVTVKEETPRYVRLLIYGGLSTHDRDQLTRLVVAAHTYGVRAEVTSCNMQYLSVWLHPRSVREGGMWDGHPDTSDLAKRAIDHSRQQQKGTP